MDAIKKKKLIYSLWSLVYLALTIVIVVSSVSLFNNFYYESVYVSGSSMDPTFNGNDAYDVDGKLIPSHDYGIIDKDDGAKKNVKRYQIVTTYYPEDRGNIDNASYKIKRVIAKPGETFKIENYNLYLFNEKTNTWSEPLDMPFYRKGIEEGTALDHKDYEKTKLANNEYFLVGDNWGGSHDSFRVGPIPFDLLVGVVVKMEGKCIVQNGKVTEKQKTEDRYFLGVDY